MVNSTNTVRRYVIEILNLVHGTSQYIFKGNDWTDDINKAERYKDQAEAEKRVVRLCLDCKKLIQYGWMSAGVKEVYDPAEVVSG